LTPPLLGSDRLEPAIVDSVLREWGGFLLEPGQNELPWREALAAADSLFARSRELKEALAIDRSPHFRGWSEMHNERDWREQIHLGRRRPSAGTWPPYRRLEGPNLEPPEPGWSEAVGGYMDAGSNLGHKILLRVAEALALPSATFGDVARDGYLVLKMIQYHPQSSRDFARPGVAAHVDFSLLTLTLENTHGLQVRRPDGSWLLVEPPQGTLWVHAGELLEFATAGRYRAVPHRVFNRAVDRPRVSIPLFLCPPLDAEVRVVVADAQLPVSDVPGEHVHHVLKTGNGWTSFHFGEAEWRRKGLGGWCAECAAPGTVRPGQRLAE
jgi:isopenicillin N synthase-like dioxygenase